MDDLVKRLRAMERHTDLEGDVYEVPVNPDGFTAVARIEELALKLLAAEGQASDNLERAERAEAMLKEAVEAMTAWKQAGTNEDYRRAVQLRNTTLARIAQEGKE